MKELDFRDCKWLRKYLSVWYRSPELDECNNICHLTSMIFKCTIRYFAIFAIATLITYCLVSVLSLTTLMLPDGWQAPVWIMEQGLMYLVGSAVVGFVVLVIYGNCVLLNPETLHTEPKDKAPNKFVTLVKEGYKSIKDKTCVKVRL